MLLADLMVKTFYVLLKVGVAARAVIRRFAGPDRPIILPPPINICNYYLSDGNESLKFCPMINMVDLRIASGYMFNSVYLIVIEENHDLFSIAVTLLVLLIMFISVYRGLQIKLQF